MATNFLWGTRGSVLNLLTTELNSLASGSACAFGPEINNLLAAPGGYMLGDLNFKLASSSSALTSASYLDVCFVPTVDGTNYPKFTSGSSYKLAVQNYKVGTIWLFPGTLSSEAIYECLPGVRIPGGKFKTVLINQSGVTLPSSGNTLDLYPTPEQY